MKNYQEYAAYKKPRWAPPAWLFAPVWSLLYLLIALSYGFVLYLYLAREIPFLVFLPFLANLISNAAFTTIQFRFHNFFLATIDVLLVFLTLLWALYVVYPYVAWVAYINLPYLGWVCFATILQIRVASLNGGNV